MGTKKWVKNKNLNNESIIYFFKFIDGITDESFERR